MSIEADTQVIPRVEQKVNLPGAFRQGCSTHPAKGEIASGCREEHLRRRRCAPEIMNQNLFYRAPDPSRATRRIARRSKASLRGSMVVLLPGFSRPCIIQFESALEYAFLCLMLVRGDIHHIWDQPPAIHYVDGGGCRTKHIFDFLITTTGGERIAVAIKPMLRVVERNFLSELELVAVATPKQFADRVLLITDQHIDRAAATRAARELAFKRPSLTEGAA